MPKVYLRWKKAGNKLSARWTKNEPQELTMEKPTGVWRAPYGKQDNILNKNMVDVNR